MKIFTRTLILCALIFAGIVSAPATQAAPGDFLFLWGAPQHLEGALEIAVDGAGNVYVTTRENIQVFNSAGVRIRKWGSYGSGDGQVSYPNGIAVDATGRVYVADTGNDRVQVFDSSGTFLGKWADPAWATNPPASVASDGKGQVYVAESGANARVRVFDSAGKLLRVLETPQGENVYLGGVAVDAAGNVYVVDSDSCLVRVFGPDGTFIKTTAEGAYYAIGVAASGNIYSLSYDGWSTQVELWDSAGNHLKSFSAMDLVEYEHYWDPIALAVDAKGNLYTLDAGNDGLRVFDSSWSELPQWWSYGIGPGQMNGPTSVATDSSGNVYETDGFGDGTGFRNDRVQAFSREGVSLGKWDPLIPLSGLSSAITIDNDNGLVYLLAGQNGGVGTVANVFDTSGNYLRSWGQRALYEDDYPSFNGIAVDRRGNVLVTNDWDFTGSNIVGRVRIYDKEGTFLRNMESPRGFSVPTGLAVDQAGYIYVVDESDASVQIFDSSYAFITKWGSAGSGDGQFNGYPGIAVDGSGHVFIADPGNNRIQVFDRSGTFLKKWGGAGDDDGFFRSPSGVAVDRSGMRVYVADTGNNRIQVFEGYPAVFSVSGTVRQGSATGPLLAGATVSIAGKSATTSSTGAFSITGIAPGTYTLTISKAGYVTKTVTGFVVSADVIGAWYYLFPAYTMSGTVRQGSATGPVLAGATVSIAGKTTTTSSTGTFSITGIPAGTYTFAISKTGYVTRTVTGYVVSSNQSGRVFYLSPAYSISGMVRAGSATGPVLAGATVAIAGKTTTTSSTGTFSVTGIPSGTYTLTISKSGYATRTVTGFVVSGNRTGLVYYLLSAYSISGTVRQGSATGPVLAGAKVAIAGKTVLTGSTGTFSITGIPSGTYTLTISKSGYATKGVTGYVVNSNKSGLVFFLSPAYSISGTVRIGSATGPVLAGAKVAIAGQSAITGSTGAFTITGIPAGTYTVTISRTGYMTKTVTGFAVTSNRSGLVFYLTLSSAAISPDAGAVARAVSR